MILHDIDPVAYLKNVGTVSHHQEFLTGQLLLSSISSGKTDNIQLLSQYFVHAFTRKHICDKIWIQFIYTIVHNTYVYKYVSSIKYLST